MRDTNRFQAAPSNFGRLEQLQSAGSAKTLTIDCTAHLKRPWESLREKAFDKIDQTALFEAMERMNIDPKLINITKELYKNPK